MYQSSSYPDTESLERWMTKKYELLSSPIPHPPQRSISQHSDYRSDLSSIDTSPLPPPRTPISDYKIKLTTSKKVPGTTQNFEIPITRSLYLKLKNRSPTNPVTGDLQPTEEIDYLTTLLMDSLANSDDPHIIGICYACGTKVSGEENGCLAFGRLYHVSCFCCVTCKNPLRGNAFYIVNNQPYCQHDYLQTLEKCKTCKEPITDKLINSEDGSYHANCFFCSECKKNLDGVAFAINKFGENHCLTCFHQKYAPRCDRCNQPIAPTGNDKETVRIQALNRSFHLDCYRCQDCLLPLSTTTGELLGCYPHTNLILCENCYNTRINLEAKTNIRTVLE